MRISIRLFVTLFIVSSSSSYATSATLPDNFDGLLLAQNTTPKPSNNVASSSPNTIYGPVRKNETLWQIARQHQFAGVTMSQLVMAIYLNNRSAFDEGDINRLKTGVKLKIPSTNSIVAKKHQQAYSEVVTHTSGSDTSVNDQEQKTIKPSLTQSTNSPVKKEVLEETSDQSNLQLVDIESTDIAVVKQELLPEQVQIGAVQIEEETKVAPIIEVPKKPRKRKPKKQEKPLFRYSYDVSIVNDDNIRRAQNEVDIRTDNILNLTLNAKAGKSLGRFSLLTYGGSISAEKFATFEELDNVSINANVRYRFAFASGFTSPIYFIGLKVGGIESDKVARDSTVFTVNLGLNKWITDTINMSLGLDYKQRESRSRVFDTVENRLFANLDINLSKTALLYSTYTYIVGDIVSSATPTLAIINASEVIEPDDAFGGISTNQFAYRLDSDTQVITLGYNQVLSAKMSLDFSYRFVKTESDGNIEYDRSIVRASLLGRF